MGSRVSLPSQLSPSNVSLADANSENVSVIIITESAMKKLQGQLGEVKKDDHLKSSNVSFSRTYFLYLMGSNFLFVFFLSKIGWRKCPRVT